MTTMLDCEHCGKLEASQVVAITQTDCEGCGACCSHVGRPPFRLRMDSDGSLHNVDPYLLQAPPEVQLEYMQIMRTDAGNAYGWCYWLDLATRRCKHYEYRPEVCREFKPGCNACLSMRAEQQTITQAGVTQRETR